MFKALFIAGSLALALAVSAGAIEPQAPSMETLDTEVQDLTDQLREATEEIHSLQERVREIEDRLGDSFGSISPFDTIERRLEELERK